MGLREDLVEYSERSMALIEESPQMDEQNTKRKVIEPLIKFLGWDILSTDVELEYSVQMGSGTKKADYALKIEDTPVVFVEAKGCDTELNSTHQSQLKSYMRQVGVDWGLLTNGREFEILRRDMNSTRPNEVSLASFTIEDVPKNAEPLCALSVTSIESGESRHIAEKIEAVQRAVGQLRSSKEQLAEEVTKVVTDVAGDSVSQQVEDEAKAFIDQLIDSLESQAHRPGSPTGRPTRTTPEPDSGYAIDVIQDGVVLQRVSGRQQAEAMAALADYLIEDHGLMQSINIPYVPGTGRGDRALINTRPEHTDGSKMRQSRQLGNGHHLFTSLSAKSKKRYIDELVQVVGLECEYSGAW